MQHAFSFFVHNKKNKTTIETNEHTMTIKVEREALLRVLTRQPYEISSSSKPLIREEDEYLLIEWHKPFNREEDSPVVKLRASTDDDSCCTLSTTSISDDSDAESDLGEDKGVSFSEEIVTEIWTRPSTPKEAVSELFYSTEETQR